MIFHVSSEFKKETVREFILKWKTGKYLKAVCHHCSKLLVCLNLITSIMSVLSCTSSSDKSDLVDDLAFTHESNTQSKLGLGTDHSQLRTYGRCLNFKESTKSLNFGNRDYQETSITSRRQLNEMLSVDTRAAAIKMFGEAAASVHSFQDVDFVDENFYWLVYANYDTSEKNIDTGSPEFDLTSEAKEILQKNGLEAFYKACGTEFYSGHRLGARHGLLYEFSAQEEETIKRLRVAASSRNMGLNVADQFEQLLSLAAKSGMLRIHSYFQKGGEKLSAHAMSPAELKDSFQTLHSDFSNHRSGIAVVWYTQSYDMLEEVQAASKLQAEPVFSDDEERRLALEDYYKKYLHNRDQIARIRTLAARGDGDEPMVAYSSNQLQHLQILSNGLAVQNDEIMSRGSRCLNYSSPAREVCTMHDLEPVAVNIPLPLHNFSSFGPWHGELVISEDRMPAFDLILTHSRTKEVRVMNSGIFMEDYNYGVVLRAGTAFEEMGLVSDGSNGKIIIGTKEQVIDPISNTRRPNICVYNSKHRCSIRVIPVSGLHSINGQYPSVKVQITLYNAQGLPLPRTIDFPETVN